MIEQVFKVINERLDLCSFGGRIQKKYNHFDYDRIIGDKRDHFAIVYLTGNGFFISNILPYGVIFENVNNILSKTGFHIESETTVSNFPGYDVQNFESIFDLPEKNIEKPNGEIDYQTLQEVTETIFVYIQSVLPFFDMVSSLQVVNDEIINKIPQMELSDYIPGEMHLKKLIIMKLCKNSGYYEYVKWLEGSFQKGIEMNRAIYEPEMLVYKKVFDFLESENL